MLSRSAFALTVFASAFAAGNAYAKDAHCFTSDDGEYDCQFVATDDAGSFEISAPDKPTFSIIIEEPGVATGYGDFGTGSTPLPGTFFRDDVDPACWVNGETDTRICAW